LVEKNKAFGVKLKNGEEYHSRYVISNANPYHTFIDLIN